MGVLKKEAIMRRKFERAKMGARISASRRRAAPGLEARIWKKKRETLKPTPNKAGRCLQGGLPKKSFN
jgi:hypothetical protein